MTRIPPVRQWTAIGRLSRPWAYGETMRRIENGIVQS